MQQDNSHVQVMIRLRTKADKLHEATQVLERVITPIRANKDNSEFRVLQDKNDASIFTLIEKWRDMDSVAAHSSQEYFKEFLNRQDELFDLLDRAMVQEILPSSD